LYRYDALILYLSYFDWHMTLLNKFMDRIFSILNEL